jgi:hypothetical protein
MIFSRSLRPAVLVALTLAALHADEPKPAGKILFKIDFESAKPGAAPEEFMVLGGQFAVEQIDSNKVLELPGAPLDDFGALFGPAQAEDIAVRARIRSQGSRRLAPRFGVGLCGASGYRLLVVPAKKELQLFKDQEAVASAPFEWQSGAWTWLHLQIEKAGDGKWKVEGKAWADGRHEPAQWTLSFDAAEKPVAGKASVWGAPYSGKPIWFDDLSVLSLAK